MTLPFSPALLKVGLILALVAGAYVKGCSDEKERFDRFKGGVEAVGKAQEERTAERIRRDKQLQLEAENAHKAALNKLTGQYERYIARLRDNPGRGNVPTTGTSTGYVVREGDICFDREQLASGMGEADRILREGAARLLRKGEEALTDSAGWGGWARGIGSCPSPVP